MYINGFDHPNILAGAGTMGIKIRFFCLFAFFSLLFTQVFFHYMLTGLEIIEQVPDVEAVVIPVGGGGLIAGCAVALKTMKPDIQIIVS